IVGSPTLNGNMFPTVSDLLTYIRGLKPSNLIGGVFGSFGWSGEALKQVENIMNEMKIELVDSPLGAKYIPDSDVLEKCRNLGLKISEKLTAKCKANV
ncbi:MAG: FprA family A-type flavoprotein, partial [bacterium]